MTDREVRELADAFASDERFIEVLPQMVLREVAFFQRHEALRVEHTTDLMAVLSPGKPPRRATTCEHSRSATVNGTGRTDSQGRRRIRLNDAFPCDGRDFPRGQISFTATALSRSAVTLTTQVTAEDVELDVLWSDEHGKLSGSAPKGQRIDVDVLSWDAAGEPAGRVDFHWICITQVAAIFVPGS